MVNLNKMLAACPFAAGTMKCRTDGTDKMLEYNDDGSNCEETAAALNSIVKEYTGPNGRTEDITCFNDVLV